MSQRVLDSNRSTKATTSLAASVFAGAGIGLMVGLLLGLSAPSAKSTVGIFIGAVGVALAALLGLNDRHFSTAKGLRIGSFGLAVVLAAPFGIYARDHGLFSPSFEERIAEVMALDYSRDEAFEFVLAAQTAASKSGQSESGATTAAKAIPAFGMSALFASEAQISACDTLVSAEPYHVDAPFDQVKKYFSDAESDWGKLADAADKQFSGDDRRNVLLIARDAVCERREFGPTFRPGPEACTAFRVTPGTNTATIPMVFAPLVQRVASDISPGARRAATQFVAGTVCSNE